MQINQPFIILSLRRSKHEIVGEEARCSVHPDAKIPILLLIGSEFIVLPNSLMVLSQPIQSCGLKSLLEAPLAAVGSAQVCVSLRLIPIASYTDR